MLAILGTTRALFLFADPYSSGENGVRRLVYSIAFPSLTSSFCLIHLAFLDVTKIKLGSKKLQSARLVSGVIISHFALEIMAAVANANSGETRPFDKRSY